MTAPEIVASLCMTLVLNAVIVVVVYFLLDRWRQVGRR